MLKNKEQLWNALSIFHQFPSWKKKGPSKKWWGYFESFSLENNQGILLIEVYVFFILNVTSKVVNDGDSENQNKML